MKFFYFNTNKLRSTLPSSLGNMDSLLYALWHENSFTGQIPPEFGRMSSLLYFYVHFNRLSGTIPSALGALGALKDFFVCGNSIAGTIPKELGSLSSLQQLYLYSNSLTGTIASELTVFSAMRIFHLSINRLNGTLPSELGSMASLNSLYLDRNSFEGTIPSSLGSLQRVQYLYLSRNKLTGPLPTALASMTNMFIMHISENSIRGPIPSYLGTFSRLKSITFQDNQFTGAIPSELSLLSKSLETVYLGNNILGDQIPSSLCKLSGLKALQLSENSLVGTLPSCLGSESFPMPSLLELDVYSNRLEGTISSSIASFPTLTLLRLGRNRFSGTVPSVIFSSASKLETLALNNNELVGALPSTMSSLHSLNTLFLQGNAFTGDLTAAFSTKMTKLLTIDVSDNEFTGTFPSVFFDMVSLDGFAAAKNCFHGSLPPNICSATRLQSLILDGLTSSDKCITRIPLTPAFLSHNMEGTIPKCLLQLPVLYLLHMSGNGFTGDVSNLLKAHSNTAELVLSHNRLTGTIPKRFNVSSQISRLDLSYNRISGSINQVNWDILDKNSIVILKENRISGRLPDAFIGKADIDVLSGNIFGCRADGMPSSDPAADQYRCGSEVLDTSFVSWAAAVGFFLLVISFAVIWSFFSHSRGVGISRAIQTVTNVWTRYTDYLAVARSVEPMDNSTYRHLRSFLTTLREIRSVTIAIGLVVVLLFGPVFLLLKHVNVPNAYSTYSTQYSYEFSAMYLAGYAAAAIVLALWAAVLAYFSVGIAGRRHPTHRTKNEYGTYDDGKGNGNDDARNTAVGAASDLRTTNWGSERTAEMEERTGDRWKFAFVVLFNTVIVSTANGLFIFESLASDVSTEEQSLIRTALVLFNFFWNHVSMHCIILLYSSRLQSENKDVRRHRMVSFLMVFIPFFNTAVIPLFSSALLDSSCFQRVFNPDDDIDATYSYQVCSRSFLDFNSGSAVLSCLAYSYSGLISTAFKSTFRYSYTCSSALLNNYIPVLIFGFLMKCIFSPLLALFIELTDWPHDSILSKIAPAILWPQNALRSDDKLKLFDAVKITAFSRTHLSVLMSFGIASPPVAVAAVVTVCVQTWLYEMLIGRAILTIAHFETEETKMQLETAERGAGSAPTNRHSADEDIVISDAKGDAAERLRSVSSVRMASIRTPSNYGVSSNFSVSTVQKSLFPSSELQVAVYGGDVIDHPSSVDYNNPMLTNSLSTKLSNPSFAADESTSSGKSNNKDIFEALDNTVVGSSRGFISWVWLTILFSCIFFLCIGIDMSGDQLGFLESTWVFAVCATVLAVGLYSFHRSRRSADAVQMM